MLRVIQTEWKFFVVLAFVLMVAGVAYYEYKHYMAANYKPVKPAEEKSSAIIVNANGDKGSPGDPQVVYIQGENTQTKEIVYVPKETNQKSGMTEKTDVQFEKKQGKIFVKVNGQEFEVPVDVQESVRFEKGKLVVTEEAAMRIHLTTPKPAVSLGIGWSSRGPAAAINGPLYNNVSWWMYGDRRTVTAGVQFPIMNK